MKIGILIPDRGDRPRFLANCMRMVHAQSLQPWQINVVSYPPKDQHCDITPRYRTGYQLLSDEKELDLIAFIENDDWYAPDYLETMAAKWVEMGRPDIFGTNYTFYYHLRLRKYYKMEHWDRASAMNTFIKPGLGISWPVDREPFTDMSLWGQLKGVAINPGRVISIGIKHGEGLCGGQSHVTRLHRYDPPRGTHDFDYSFLSSVMDRASLEFYTSYYNGEPI